MSIEHWLITLAIGAFVGWLAGLFLRGSGYGIIGNIVVGLLGALVGTLVFRALTLTLPLGNALAERIIVALAGALLLMVVVGFLRPRSFRERAAGFWRRRRA